MKLFQEWPTPIVVSGFEIGEAMPFPASRIDTISLTFRTILWRMPTALT